jgi:hypothetical protein
MTTFFHKVGAFFEGLVQSPAASPAAAGVVSTLKTAETQIEAALPGLANAAVNAALAFIPAGVGTELDPIADSLIDQVIARPPPQKSAAAPSTSSASSNAASGTSSSGVAAGAVGAAG